MERIIYLDVADYLPECSWLSIWMERIIYLDVADYLRRYVADLYNHLIKKLSIWNILLSESEEYYICWILSMYGLFRV